MIFRIIRDCPDFKKSWESCLIMVIPVQIVILSKDKDCQVNYSLALIQKLHNII